MSWAAVEENSASQLNQFSRISNNGEAIEAFYPELHGPELEGQFVNVSGGPLIADLITAPHVVFDLYPYRDEAELIQRVGVDLKFLLALRDRKLITIAANADLSAYRDCSWIYHVLADQRTLFRSVRTPLFFQAICPDIVEKRENLKSYLERRFNEMSSDEFALHIAHTAHWEAPTAQSLARQLSWEWARVESLSELTFERDAQESEQEGYSIDDVLRRPDKWLPVLYRDFTLIVTPHSGALGGVARIPSGRLRQWFPESAHEPDLMELSYFDEIHQFLLSVGPKINSVTISGSQYWASLDRMQRHVLLDCLSDSAGERSRLMRVERNLRSRIGKLDGSITCEDIYDFVQQDIKLTRSFEAVGNLAYNLVCTSFGAAIDLYMNWFGGLLGSAMGFETGRILKGEIVKSKAKAALEFALPRIQVANYVRDKRK